MSVTISICHIPCYKSERNHTPTYIKTDFLEPLSLWNIRADYTSHDLRADD